MFSTPATGCAASRSRPRATSGGSPKSARKRRAEDEGLSAFFVFPGESSWNEAEEAVEFAIELGEYRGRVFVPARVFQGILGHRAGAEECVRICHLERTRFERVAEAKIRARELADDGNLRIDGRDLRRLEKPAR